MARNGANPHHVARAMTTVKVAGENRKSQGRLSPQARLLSFARYLTRPLLAALLLTIFDSIGLVLFQGLIDQPTLVLLIFLEGGAGLLVGVGISLSSTPAVSRIGSTVLGTATWSIDAEKHAQRVGLKWMIASALLVLIGFVLSVA
jgi:hypothetical protein